MGSRVLDSVVSPGRVLVVDAQGNGDHDTIQEAIDAAQAATPSVTAQWVVLVAPGLYPESLTLYDYVNITADGRGKGSILKPTGAVAVLNGAACTISNLLMGGDTTPIVQTGAGHTGVLRLEEILVIESIPEIDFLNVASGSVILKDCDIQAGGSPLVLSGGTAKVYQSLLNHYHEDGGAATEHTVNVSGGTLHLVRSTIENTSPAGAGVMFSGEPTAAKILDCIVRRATGDYSIDAALAVTVYIAGCLVNDDIDTADISGWVSYLEDANL